MPEVGIPRHIAEIVDVVVVAAAAADHEVGAGTAVEDVRGVVAPNVVVETVAGAVYRVGPEKIEVLDIGVERVADRGIDPIDAFIGILNHYVAGIRDGVLIIADAADHGVGAATAIDTIVAVAAGEHVDAAVAVDVVVEAVAGAVDCASAAVRWRCST